MGRGSSKLYKTDLDLAALGAVDATGRPLSDDLRYWNALLNADADFDDSGSVDATDLGDWAEGFGIPVAATNLQGDADGDRDVDGNDFLLWQRQLGAPASALVAPVPEPAMTIHAASLAVALASLRRSRRKKRKNVPPCLTRGIAARRQRATRAPSAQSLGRLPPILLDCYHRRTLSTCHCVKSRLIFAPAHPCF
jgi:hypothetical protein